MPVVTPPDISTLPPAPVRGQAGFSTATGTFLEALPDWGDELDAAGQATHENAQVALEAATEVTAAAAVAIDAAGYVGNSNSSVTLTAGDKAIVLTAAKPLLAEANKRVVLVNPADPSIKAFGSIKSSPTPTSTSFTVTVVTSGIFGSGTYSDWLVMDAAFLTAAATPADIWAGTSDGAASTPKGLADSAAFQTLTDAATVAWNTATQGYNAKVTLGGNRNMGTPTNLKDGVTYTLHVIQDGTGSRTMTWPTIWDWGAAGTPALSTGAGKIDKVTAQYDSTANKLQASFRKAA